MSSKKVHIVGEKNSFTFNACVKRYPNGYEFSSHSHAVLVNNLLDKKIPVGESSIVPLWNANVGTIDMDRRTKTSQIFMGEAGNIVDLWPEQIIFELGVRGNGELLTDCDIYSVHVAKDQCSNFLKSINVHEQLNRFKGDDTTTIAANSFKTSAKQGDGLLCGSELLNSEGLTPKGNRANPYNMTVFSTIDSLPINREKKKHIYSLGCILVDLNGDTLPIDFVDYWKGLLPEYVAEKNENLLLEMPKIMFIIRYEGAKALLLLEMPSPDFLENPWPTPDIIEIDPSVDRKSEIVSCEQVGGIYESYVETENNLFSKDFKLQNKDIIFYGLKDTFLWGSPAINIFVHGFDQNLVKECARLQVMRLIELKNYGIAMHPDAEEILKKFEDNPGNILLSTDSQPFAA